MERSREVNAYGVQDVYVDIVLFLPLLQTWIQNDLICSFARPVSDTMLPGVGYISIVSRAIQKSA